MLRAETFLFVLCVLQGSFSTEQSVVNADCLDFPYRSLPTLTKPAALTTGNITFLAVPYR